jgi:hypothetical protein
MWKRRVFLGTSLISQVVPSLVFLNLHGVVLVEVALQKPISGLLVPFLAIFDFSLSGRPAKFDASPAVELLS